jgi:hypothetical protein
MIRGCERREAPFGANTCEHVIPARRDPPVNYLKFFRWLTGNGVEADYLCPDCVVRRESGESITLVETCSVCSKS